MKRIVIVFALCMILAGCGRQEPEAEETDAGETALEAEKEIEMGESLPEQEEEKSASVILEERVEEKMGSMSLEEKVAQLFVITPEALTGVDTVVQAGETSRECLRAYPVGGLIYMAANLENPEQTRQMLQNMQEFSDEIAGLPLFLSVDEEGGTVARVASNGAFGVENVGNMSEIGATGDAQNAYQAGKEMGQYLSELGFNLDFAPVADVLTNPDNQVVRDRSFGSDVALVSEMVSAVIRGLEENDVYACVKHFPGHGNTAEDSHEGYALTDKTLEELEETEFMPFRQGIEDGIAFLMVGHISVPAVTGDELPASLSRTVVTNILRGNLGYEGIVITDALNMGAIMEHYSSGEAAVMTFQAGADMLLMPGDFAEAYQALLEAVESGAIGEDRLDESVRRILRVKLSME